jgi:hypothetical protein
VEWVNCTDYRYRDNGKDLMSYLGDTPETNFKQAQLIHLLALPEEYCDPSTESALAQKLGVNRTALYRRKKAPYLHIHDRAASLARDQLISHRGHGVQATLVLPSQGDHKRS